MKTNHPKTSKLKMSRALVFNRYALLVFHLAGLSACSLVTDKKIANEGSAKPSHKGSVSSVDDQPTVSHSLTEVNTKPQVEKKASVVLVLSEGSQLGDAELKHNLTHTSQTHYVADQPILIPTSMPEEYGFSFVLPTIDLEQVSSVSVSARVGDGLGPETRFEVSSFEMEESENDSDEKLSVRISSSSTVFWSGVTSQAYLTIQLKGQNASQTLASIKLPLLVPPMTLHHEQLSLKEYELVEGPLDPGMRTYRSYEKILNLAQVISLRNDSQYQIIAKVPLEPSGTLSTPLTVRTRDGSFCHHVASVTQSTDVISDEMMMLPLTQSLRGANFSRFMTEHLATGDFEVALLPGEKKSIGLYAVGSRATIILEHGYPKQTFQTEKATSQCLGAVCVGYWGTSRRANETLWMALETRDANRYYFGQGALCHRLWNVCTAPYGSQGHNGAHTADCLTCALWETSLPSNVPSILNWHDPLRFCQGQWNIIKQERNESFGTESGSLTLSLTEASTEVQLRYQIEVAESGASPSRTVNHLIQNRIEQVCYEN